MEQASQGSEHGPELLELREHLDNTLSQRVWILGGCVWIWELDWSLRDLFSLGYPMVIWFYDPAPTACSLSRLLQVTRRVALCGQRVQGVERHIPTSAFHILFCLEVSDKDSGLLFGLECSLVVLDLCWTFSFGSSNPILCVSNLLSLYCNSA